MECVIMCLYRTRELLNIPCCQLYSQRLYAAIGPLDERDLTEMTMMMIKAKKTRTIRLLGDLRPKLLVSYLFLSTSNPKRR